MTNREVKLDLEIVKEIAEAAAVAAANRVVHKLREDVRAEHAEMRADLMDTVRREISSYHGDMTASEHAIQHSRIDRYLAWLDRLSQNFWGSLAAAFLKVIVGLFLLGYFVVNYGIPKFST